MPSSPAVVSLADLPRGHCAEVVGFACGRLMAQRMLMLGIRRGVSLCVVHGPGQRGVVVEVGGARIALGRGVCEKILVAPRVTALGRDAAA